MLESLLAGFSRIDGLIEAINWATLAAVVAALAAAYQIRQSRAESRRQAAFDHLRRITSYVGRVVQWPDVREIQDGVLRFYNGEVAELGPQASEYMTLLTELDLLAYASAEGAVDRSIERSYTQSMFHQNVVTPEFIREYQRKCGNELPYKHLLARLEEVIPEEPNVKRYDRSATRRLDDWLAGRIRHATWWRRRRADAHTGARASFAEVRSRHRDEANAATGELPATEES